MFQPSLLALMIRTVIPGKGGRSRHVFSSRRGKVFCRSTPCPNAKESPMMRMRNSPAGLRRGISSSRKPSAFVENRNHFAVPKLPKPYPSRFTTPVTRTRASRIRKKIKRMENTKNKRFRENRKSRLEESKGTPPFRKKRNRAGFCLVEQKKMQAYNRVSRILLTKYSKESTKQTTMQNTISM